MAEPQIIIEHLVGSRRGERQVFSPGSHLRFGRHPDSDVRFDAHRDIDASSRHAEIEPRGDHYVLRDVGSSNGTLVNGERVTEVAIAPDESTVVEFGPGGPRVRVFVGDPDKIPPPPAITDEYRAFTRRFRVALGAAIAAIVIIAAAVWMALV